MSTAFPFFGLWTGFWPLGGMSVFELLGLAIVTTCMFPFVLNGAVVTASITQLFFRGVSTDFAVRLRMALKANSVGAISSFFALILSSGILTASSGDIEVPAYFLLFVICPFVVPGICEACMWSRWTTRPVVLRAMVAHLTGRCVFVVMILAARWIRELMIGTWIERFRGEAITLLHAVGFFCLGILALAWLRSPKIFVSPNMEPKETGA